VMWQVRNITVFRFQLSASSRLFHPHGIIGRSLLSSSSSSSSQKPIGRERRRIALQKEAELADFLRFGKIDRNERTKTTMIGQQKLNVDPHHSSLSSPLATEMVLERNRLISEAAFVTRSLYRNCVRCVEMMKSGNDNDENEFKKREQKQMDDLEGVGSGSFSFEPPVDRKNELTSRANYYLETVREGFHQESDCLLANPWREEDVNRFLSLLRFGEERRRWILLEYKFDDPYLGRFNEDRVNDFEGKAGQLVKETYRSKGWLLTEELTEKDEGITDEDESFWKEEEEEDEEKGKMT